MTKDDFYKAREYEQRFSSVPVANLSFIQKVWHFDWFASSIYLSHVLRKPTQLRALYIALRVARQVEKRRTLAAAYSNHFLSLTGPTQVIPELLEEGFTYHYGGMLYWQPVSVYTRLRSTSPSYQESEDFNLLGAIKAFQI